MEFWKLPPNPDTDFVADITLMWPLSCVSQLVHLQVVFCRKTLQNIFKYFYIKLHVIKDNNVKQSNSIIHDRINSVMWSDTYNRHDL